MKGDEGGEFGVVSLITGEEENDGDGDGDGGGGGGGGKI